MSDLLPDDEDALARAAGLMTRGRPAVCRTMLHAAMRELADNAPQTGAGSFDRWLSALRALGEVCLTLHKMLAARRLT